MRFEKPLMSPGPPHKTARAVTDEPLQDGRTGLARRRLRLKDVYFCTCRSGRMRKRPTGQRCADKMGGQQRGSWGRWCKRCCSVGIDMAPACNASSLPGAPCGRQGCTQHHQRNAHRSEIECSPSVAQSHTQRLVVMVELRACF